MAREGQGYPCYQRDMMMMIYILKERKNAKKFVRHKVRYVLIIYMYVCVCVYLGSLFFVNAYFIKQYRHVLSTFLYMSFPVAELILRCPAEIGCSRLTISFGSFINPFPPDTVKSIQQMKKTYTKI